MTLTTSSFVGCYGYAQETPCITSVKIKNTIEDFINNGDNTIYKNKFIKLFAKSNKYHNNCYFFANIKNENLYFYLGDSVLLKKVKTDDRAMRLLIDLYLVNKNNAELSEYYGTKIIPKAASENIGAFVKVLSKKTERETNTCINKLKNIDNDADKENIRKELTKFHKQKYLLIVNKILERLQ